MASVTIRESAGLAAELSKAYDDLLEADARATAALAAGNVVVYEREAAATRVLVAQIERIEIERAILRSLNFVAVSA